MIAEAFNTRVDAWQLVGRPYHDIIATKQMANGAQVMLDAVRQFQEGEPAIGTTEPRIAHVELRSFEGVVPKSVNWRTLGASAEELAQYPGEELAPSVPAGE
jgi:hypothetical protein